MCQMTKQEVLLNDANATIVEQHHPSKTMVSGAYGHELVLDLHGCDAGLFNREHIDEFFTELCRLIDMEKCDVHFWDDLGVPPEEQQKLPHTKGTSAVCFIITSTIVVHTLDLLDAVYVNIFSCKSFNSTVATEFTNSWFKSASCNRKLIERT